VLCRYSNPGNLVPGKVKLKCIAVLAERPHTSRQGPIENARECLDKSLESAKREHWRVPEDNAGEYREHI